MQGDARQAAKLLPKFGAARHVLCDVPCSGLGILRKKPDIREKLHTELDKLPEMQYSILCAGSVCVAQDGVLLYATCTLNPAENEAVCRRFLDEHPAFVPEPVLPDIPGLRSAEGFLTLAPHLSGTDGFYLAKFQRCG
jgi:16S rRNA (cytosine967-C5)-methyltransferase